MPSVSPRRNSAEGENRDSGKECRKTGFPWRGIRVLRRQRREPADGTRSLICLQNAKNQPNPKGRAGTLVISCTSVKRTLSKLRQRRIFRADLAPILSSLSSTDASGLQPAAKTGALDGADVNEHILLPVRSADEAKPFDR